MHACVLRACLSTNRSVLMATPWRSENKSSKWFNQHNNQVYAHSVCMHTYTRTYALRMCRTAWYTCTVQYLYSVTVLVSVAYPNFFGPIFLKIILIILTICIMFLSIDILKHMPQIIHQAAAGQGNALYMMRSLANQVAQHRHTHTDTHTVF